MPTPEPTVSTQGTTTSTSSTAERTASLHEAGGHLESTPRLPGLGLEWRRPWLALHPLVFPSLQEVIGPDQNCEIICRRPQEHKGGVCHQVQIGTKLQQGQIQGCINPESGGDSYRVAMPGEAQPGDEENHG